MVTCVYGLISRKTQRILHLHWYGMSTEFIILYAQLEERRGEPGKRTRLAYAYAVTDSGEVVYEHGSAEDIEHAKTVYQLSREDPLFKPRRRKSPTI